MSSGTRVAATIDDLYKVEGKAELIAGRIVRFMPTGFLPGQVGGRIYQALDRHARATGGGVALPDGVGFVVSELASGRQSFSPDAAYFVGTPPADLMDFVEGAPALAVEVRSKGDYGRTAEAEMAAKRADYFEAGTLAVWDVDPVAEVIRCFRADSPDRPTEFRRGEVADAEPAVPGWRVAVDEILS